MKLLLSTSGVADYPVKSRVAVREGPNEWYTGTVSKQGRIKITVDFDDGNVYDYRDPTTKTVQLIGTRRKNKYALTNAELLMVRAPGVPQRSPIVVKTKVKPKTNAELKTELGELQRDYLNSSSEMYQREKRIAAGTERPHKDDSWKKPYYAKFKDLNVKITDVLARLGKPL